MPSVFFSSMSSSILCDIGESFASCDVDVDDVATVAVFRSLRKYRAHLNLTSSG